MKLKQTLTLLTAAGMCLANIPLAPAIMPATALTASAANSGSCGENVTWALNNGVLTISGTGAMADQDLPNTFSSLNFSEAVIMDGVTSIGQMSFERCFGLKTVTIPNSVTSIGFQAFYQCTALTDITIPESVTDFDADVFNETPWLEAKQKENPLVVVNDILIDGSTCSGEITIPDGITSIGTYAFDLCKELTDVKIPDSVTSIRPGAFASCWNLKSIIIPKSVTRIEDAAFSRCSSLTDIQIPDSVTSIGAAAFRSCYALTSITIPNSVTSIDKWAFDDCSNLTSITIPSSVTNINEWTFTGCKELTIKGYTGSYAETYAKEKDIPFESLGEMPVNDWDEKQTISRNTAEAELVVRVGDIDACNDEDAVAEHGYNPFTAKSQYAHGYPWPKDETDPAGTDRIFVGSKWNGETTDGYSSNYSNYKNGNDTENAYGDGALSFTMEYDASEIELKNVILQLCIDDFQADSWNSVFSVTLNGKDAPFIAELLNHTDQTGPTAYIVSAMIPDGFFADIASGKLTVVIDETTGIGDGYAIDFAKLLINYNDQIFTGSFSGKTEPGATVRLLGTSTTVTASSTGKFAFSAIPGINAVRASKAGFVENYDSGIVLSAGTEWKPEIRLEEGEGTPDIDFSKFAETGLTIKGECNGDGTVSVEDAQIALLAYVQTMAGLDSGLTEQQIKAADINGDNTVSVEDAQLILLYYVSNTLSGQNVTWDELLGK